MALWSPQPLKAAAQLGQGLRRVDVRQNGGGIECHFPDLLGVCGKQLPGADIALKRQHLGKARRGPYHGVAALAAMGGDDDGLPVRGHERLNQAIKVGRPQQRHIAECHQRPANLARQGANARFE